MNRGGNGEAGREAELSSAHPYSRLTPDLVIEAVESTGRLSDARILALNSYENRVYQVGIEESEPVIVKFYRPGRWSDAQIDEEHRFTRFLFEREIPVVPPLEINPGSEIPTIANYAGFRLAIYPRQGGRAPEIDNFDHLHHLGQFIGRMHAAASAFRFEHRPRLCAAQAESNAEYLLESGFIPTELEAACRAISAEIVDAIRACPPDAPRFRAISLHGDCHCGNMLWRDDRPHFVDFDDALSGPAMQDLWMLLSGETDTRRRQLSEIIEGYEMFRDFDLAELALIEPLRAMRVLHFTSWIARRWDDPAFPLAFPWFNTPRYWSEYILELKEVMSGLQQPALTLPQA